MTSSASSDVMCEGPFANTSAKHVRYKQVIVPGVQLVGTDVAAIWCDWFVTAMVCLVRYC